MNKKMMILACLTLAGTAVAQPGTFTDLGNRTTTQSFTQNVTTLGGSDIQWFRIVLPAVAPVAGWVDIWTTPTANPVPATDLTDTEIGLFDNAGNPASVLYNDDDSGPGLYSQLSFGSTVSRGATTYPGQTNGADRNGSAGPLAGGVYWLAVGRFNVNWAPNFGATGTSTSTQTTTLLNFDIAAATDPFPPSGTGSANPSSANAGDSVLYTVTVLPGGNPLSTGLAVTGDLSSIGGSANAAFNDTGTNGDLVAGDNTFSYQFTLPATVHDANYSLPVTITDAQSRTGSTTITGTALGAVSFDEANGAGGDAGETLATAQTPSGSGALTVIVGSTDDTSDGADMYRIQICDAANFSATTEFSTGNPDTQLFLFDANGMGVEFNDDRPSGVGTSRIDTTGVSGNGVYYLAVSRYNVDPVDSSEALIFLNTPFNTIHTADGPGAANPVDHFTGTDNAFSTGAYRITLTGACVPGETGQCSVADVGIAGGLVGHDNLLDNNDFIAFITLFFDNDPQADMGMAGGLPGSDNLWDNNDFIAFIGHFFDDAALCNG